MIAKKSQERRAEWVGPFFHIVCISVLDQHIGKSGVSVGFEHLLKCGQAERFPVVP
jgi:hypothetical protein